MFQEQQESVGKPLSMKSLDHGAGRQEKRQT